MLTCRICKNSKGNKQYTVTEMMFGTGEEFLYFQCSQCGCLQIADIPPDLAPYYPPEYYAFAHSPVEMFGNPLQRWLKNTRNRYAVFDRGLLGAWLYKKFPRESLRSLSRVPGLTRSSRILDVGCGAGALLYSLRELGFANLLGVDPYIKKTIPYKNGLTIRKQELKSVTGKWDVIMFHHCFEHVADQHSTLSAAGRLLSKNGTIIIRVPTVTSTAWQQYRTHWVQLDAPRHLYLHSHQSLTMLAKQHGLKVETIVCDSSAFQCWGSVQYQHNIPLVDERSYGVHPRQSMFSALEIRQYQRLADALNRQGRGDQIVVYVTLL